MTFALEKLVKRVAFEFNLEPMEILRSGRGSPRVVEARAVAMWLVFNTWEPKPSLSEVARMFKRKNHSSASDACKWIEKEISSNTFVGNVAFRLTRDQGPGARDQGTGRSGPTLVRT